MLERDIERFVRNKTKGYLLKWVSPGESGVPDRILVIKGKVIFVEFKKPGGVLSPRQKLWVNRFEALGVGVRVISSMEEARRFLDEI